MSVRLLVAAGENDIIGRDGELPWRLPADLRRFAALTRGHAVVLGRVTHESILARLGHPLPGRHSIVVSGRNLGPQPDSVEVVASVREAADRADKVSSELGRTDWFVIGGASVYAQLLHRVDVIDLTRVHGQVDGDVCMPAGWLNGFATIYREPGTDEESGRTYTFLRLARTA